MKILSLDVSVNNVGWAVFDTKKQGKEKWSWGTYTLEGFNYDMRLTDLKDRIIEEGHKDAEHLVIEWPMFYQSTKGMIAAHNNYTIDLAGVCMYIAGWLRLDHRHYHRITASKWKGQVPKAITARKFFKHFGIPLGKVSEHAIDATMMLKFFIEQQLHLDPIASDEP